jgi:hypothetical protein
MARDLTTTTNQTAEPSLAEGSGSPDWLFEACGILAATAALSVIWLPEYPPGTDLPGHATQIYIWMNLDQGFGDTYRVNWFTPYLIGYAVARGFAELVGVVAALKLVLSIGLVGQYAAVRLLLRGVGAERWLALFSFPFFFGVAFYWGFFNFLAAVPLGLVYVALCIRFGEEPSARRWLVIALGGPVLFFAHGVVYGVCATAAGLVLLPNRLDWKRLIVRTSPVVLGAPLPLAWIFVKEGGSSRLAWRWGWERVLEVPSQWVSFRADIDTAGLAVALLILVILGSGLRRNRRPGAARPFAAAVAFFMALPELLMGVSVIYTRVGIFASCFALLLGVAPAAPGRRRWLRLRIVLAVAVLLGIHLWRTHGFAGELRGFDSVVKEIPADSRVCMSFWHRGSAFYSGMTFTHFDSWVLLQKPATTDFAWASYPTTLIRFQPGHSGRFRFSSCDYVLALGQTESFEEFKQKKTFAKLEEHAQGSLGFVKRSHRWYLLRRLSPPP